MCIYEQRDALCGVDPSVLARLVSLFTVTFVVVRYAV